MIKQTVFRTRDSKKSRSRSSSRSTAVDKSSSIMKVIHCKFKTSNNTCYQKVETFAPCSARSTPEFSSNRIATSERTSTRLASCLSLIVVPWVRWITSSYRLLTTASLMWARSRVWMFTPVPRKMGWTRSPWLLKEATTRAQASWRKTAKRLRMATHQRRRPISRPTIVHFPARNKKAADL